ncbi:uncharacterized protein LOC110189219 [Drosophila serrata]|uniref:uncharacterized protein LOC110189219 n=1 Tax=Drosophila serrata TaxID=7274 RepID=UPI000A1D02A9|nr:uncharacterized protein LOC110189219 [Drosophila serrata]
MIMLRVLNRTLPEESSNCTLPITAAKLYLIHIYGSLARPSAENRSSSPVTALAFSARCHANSHAPLRRQRYIFRDAKSEVHNPQINVESYRFKVCSGLGNSGKICQQ